MSNLITQIQNARTNARLIAEASGSIEHHWAAGFLTQAINTLEGAPKEGTILPNLGGEIDMGWTGKMPRPSADDLPIYPNGCDLPMPAAADVLR